MNTLPTCPARGPLEAAETFGLRVFTFLLQHGTPVGLLSRAQQQAALHFSQLPVTAPDVVPAVRARYHDLRLQLLREIADYDRRFAALCTPVVPPAAADAPPAVDHDGGRAVQRPVQGPPLKPAGSLVTGNALPDPATAAARVEAARQAALRVRAFALQNQLTNAGGAL